MDDKISRQAVINAYGDWYVEEGTEDGFIGTVKQLLEGFPSAQPKRMRGRWNTYYHGGTDFSYSCARCGCGAPFDMRGGKVFQKKWNFCPNCGAEMEVDNESN